MTLLFTVEDVFYISGRGCVLSVVPSGPDFKIKPSDHIQLRTPEGRVFDSHIASIEFLYGTDTDGKRHCRMAIMLPREIEKYDVPRGTEVWFL